MHHDRSIPTRRRPTTPTPPTATATGATLSMLIHGLSFNRRKAQGRSVYVCALVYSYALKLLPWIKVRCLSTHNDSLVTGGQATRVFVITPWPLPYHATTKTD